MSFEQRVLTRRILTVAIILPLFLLALFRLPQADGRPAVRLRFGHAGTDSWYFGIDDVGLYAISGTAPEPELVATVSGGNLTISWPAGLTGYILQESASLTAPAWSPVGGVVNNSVSVPIQTGNRFYRLMNPGGP